MLMWIKSMWSGCQSIWQGLHASVDIFNLLVARYLLIAMVFGGFVIFIALRLETP